MESPSVKLPSLKRKRSKRDAGPRRCGRCAPACRRAGRFFFCSRGVPVLVPVRASPVPSVVRRSFLVQFFSPVTFRPSPRPVFRRRREPGGPPCTCAYATLRPLPLPSTSTWCGSCARPAGGALRPARSARPALRCLRAPQAWIVMKTLIVVTAAFGARNRTTPSIRPCSHRMPLTLRYTISDAVAGGRSSAPWPRMRWAWRQRSRSRSSRLKRWSRHSRCARLVALPRSRLLSPPFTPLRPLPILCCWPLHLSHTRTHTHTWMPLFPFI